MVPAASGMRRMIPALTIDEGNEEADTDDDCDLERFGDRVEHCGAEAGQHEDGHQHTSPYDEYDGGKSVRGGGDGGCQQCVHAEYAAMAKGCLATTPMRMVMTPATSAVIAATCGTPRALPDASLPSR